MLSEYHAEVEAFFHDIERRLEKERQEAEKARANKKAEKARVKVL